MKTKEEFKSFFNNELSEDLSELDRKRDNINRKTLIWKVLSTSLLVFVIITYCFNIFPSGLNNYVIFFGTVLSAYFFLTVGQKKEEVMTKIHNIYKWQILPKALEYVFENSKYIPNQFISNKAISDSKIFGEFFNFEHGEDYFICEIDEVVLQFSEISITNAPALSRPKQFNGIFFVSEFNKNFNTGTILLPKNPFSIGKSVFFWISNLDNFEKIHLEDPLFNDEFVVYAEDQVESRYLLTPSFMQKILNLKEIFQSDVVISFTQQRLNIFIEKDEDLFELPVYGYYTNFEHFYKNINYFILFTSIVEELKLNINIWGKN